MVGRRVLEIAGCKVISHEEATAASATVCLLVMEVAERLSSRVR